MLRYFLFLLLLLLGRAWASPTLAGRLLQSQYIYISGYPYVCTFHIDACSNLMVTYLSNISSFKLTHARVCVSGCIMHENYWAQQKGGKGEIDKDARLRDRASETAAQREEWLKKHRLRAVVTKRSKALKVVKWTWTKRSWLRARHTQRLDGE